MAFHKFFNEVADVKQSLATRVSTKRDNAIHSALPIATSQAGADKSSNQRSMSRFIPKFSDPANPTITNNSEIRTDNAEGSVSVIDNIVFNGLKQISVQQLSSVVDASYLAQQLRQVTCPEKVEYSPVTIVFDERGIGTTPDIPGNPEGGMREFSRFGFNLVNNTPGSVILGYLIKGQRYNTFFGPTSLDVKGKVAKGSYVLEDVNSPFNLVMMLHDSNKVLLTNSKRGGASFFSDAMAPDIALIQPDSKLENRSLTSTLRIVDGNGGYQSKDVFLEIAANNLQLWVYPIYLTKELQNQFLASLKGSNLTSFPTQLLTLI